MDGENKRLNAGKNRVDDFVDLILLNILFVLCCLPVVTGGAALSALYTTVAHLREKRAYGGAAALYWAAMKRNWKRATILWSLVLVGAVLLFLDFSVVAEMDTMVKYCYLGLLAFVAVLLQVVITAGFPLLAESDCGCREILRKVFFLLARAPLRTLAACALHILPLAVALLAGKAFAALFLLWVAVYFSAAEWLIEALLRLPLEELANG